MFACPFRSFGFRGSSQRSCCNSTRSRASVRSFRSFQRFALFPARGFLIFARHVIAARSGHLWRCSPGSVAPGAPRRARHHPSEAAARRPFSPRERGRHRRRPLPCRRRRPRRQIDEPAPLRSRRGPRGCRGVASQHSRDRRSRGSGRTTLTGREQLYSVTSSAVGLPNWVSSSFL